MQSIYRNNKLIMHCCLAMRPVCFHVLFIFSVFCFSLHNSGLVWLATMPQIPMKACHVRAKAQHGEEERMGLIKFYLTIMDVSLDWSKGEKNMEVMTCLLNVSLQLLFNRQESPAVGLKRPTCPSVLAKNQSRSVMFAKPKH